MDITKLLFLTLLFFVPTTANAENNKEIDYWQKSVEFYKNEVKNWIYDDIIIDAIKTQNEAHKSLTSNEILKLDQQWVDELSGKKGNKVLIGTTINKKISQYLRSKVLQSNGFITEIILMDNKGLNVGVSDITSDYWQGDEDKWKRTFLTGAEQIYISKTYFDESAKKLQNQFSVTISDQGKPIGAITIGINAQKFHEIK